MQAIQREPIYRQIYQLLEQRILQNELQVGDVLDSEQSLAESFQVHRSSVREALRLLEENGLVQRRPGGKKLFVSLPDKDRLGSRISQALVLDEVTFRELYEGIRVLEPAISAVAAQKVTQEQLDRIAKNLRFTADNLGDAKTMLELDFEFHNLVAEASGNKVLTLSRLGVVELFYPAVNRLMKVLDVSQRILVAHEMIFQALLNGDAEQAETWSKKHADDFLRGYELAGLDINASVRPPRQ